MNNMNKKKNWLVVVFVCLFVVVGCPTNTTGPDSPEPPEPTNTNPTNGGNTVDIPVERPLYIVSSPENSLTRTVSIDANILDLYLSSGYNPDDFSVTHLDGVDVGIINTDALTIDEAGKTISGLIELNQRLDFERPIDRGDNSGDNDYEVATFRVMSETSSNDFKLIVRITDLTAEPKTLEILVDSLHLDGVNEKRGIREIYLYEDKEAMDPLMGNDPNNFLTADLIESAFTHGDVDPVIPVMNLYDGNDSTSGFLTATPVNNSGDTYHRLTLNFTEEVNIQKVGIRGRQIGGYYGFVFIFRDKDNNIIYVHQASNPLSRGSGSDETATSTYAFIADYIGFPIISDFRISLDNIYFDIAENTTDVILIDNFSVARGYEYERGFVNIVPGADVAKFNTNNLVFIDNELMGLSFKNTPDAETQLDDDGDNIYDVGTITISNFDGGKLNFNLPVRVVNIPSIVAFYSNAITVTIDPSTSTVIENLVDTNYLISLDLSPDALNLGLATYTYELSGTDGGLFETIGNKLITKNGLGLGAYAGKDQYNFQVRYIPENGASSNLNVTVQVTTTWQKISTPNWGDRFDHQAVVLSSGDIILINGRGNGGIDPFRDVLRSSDGGTNWSLVTSTVPWVEPYAAYSSNGRCYFQAVVLPNDDILVMGGNLSPFGKSFTLPNPTLRNDVWKSSDGGLTWTLINSSAAWQARKNFQAVVLNNGDILVMGGANSSGEFLRNNIDYHGNPVNDIWKSSDGGVSWSQIPATDHWSPRQDFQAVVLSNDDILVMGGFANLENRKIYNDIWKSEDGGTNWIQIPYVGDRWKHRWKFQSVVLPNDHILVMGGDRMEASFVSAPHRYPGSVNDVWISKDGGSTWNNVPNTSSHWGRRDSFQSVVLPNGQVLIMGGIYVFKESAGGIILGSGVQRDIWSIYSGVE